MSIHHRFLKRLIVDLMTRPPSFSFRLFFASQAKADSAINTFEITAPTDQRDIIVQYGFGSGAGAEPPK